MDIFSQTDPKGRASVEAWATEFLKHRDAKEGPLFVKAVHRLDKEASGVLVLARSSKGLKRLHACFREKKCTKVYWALLEGGLSQDGFLKDYLVHGDHCAQVVSSTHCRAKEALLEYKILHKVKGISLVEVLLHTGRYHQIRVQFSSRGFPILGDQRYDSQIHFDGIALHHRKLTLPHPTLKEELTFEAPLPEQWQEFLQP